MHTNFESIFLPLFDTQTILPEKGKGIKVSFFDTPNKSDFKTNMTCSGYLPTPQRFKLAGISVSVQGRVDKEDLEIIKTCLVEMIILCRPYTRIPLSVILHDNIDIANLSKIYWEFNKYQNSPISIDEIDRELINPEKYPNLYLFYPIKKEGDFVNIESAQDFRVIVSSKDSIDSIKKAVEMLVILHGYLERPCC